MHVQIAQRLKEEAEKNDIEAKIYYDYSGRGMYGSTTTGIVVQKNHIFALIALMMVNWDEYTEMIEREEEEEKVCPYCGGKCLEDEDNACDGYKGDPDGLVAEMEDQQEANREQLDREDHALELMKIRSDSMGHDTIYY